MFTGIVALKAPLIDRLEEQGIARLVVGAPEPFMDKLVAGASVAVNGVCLTVVSWDRNGIAFDVIGETLARTNLSTTQPGDLVNLERAAKVGDEVGGHPLSGHIHAVATVAELCRDEANLSMRLTLPDEWQRYLVTKGYIAVNGCSLTLGDVSAGDFWIHLIPETLRITNLEGVLVGDIMNIEFDHSTQVIVDTVERVLAERFDHGTE